MAFIPERLRTLLSRLGDNAEASTSPEIASGTVFSKIRGIGVDTQHIGRADPGAGTAGSLAHRIGQTSDASAIAGNVLARLKFIINDPVSSWPDNSIGDYVQTIYTYVATLGSNSDVTTDPSAASGTVFSKLRGIGTDLDTIVAYVDEIESRLTAVRAGNLDRIDVLSSLGAQVVAADSTANAYAAEGVGNKTDAAATTAGTTKSLQAYAKGTLNLLNDGTFGLSIIKSKIVDVENHAIDLKNRLTTTRAGYLDDLTYIFDSDYETLPAVSGSLGERVKTLKERLTAARAGYLDNLSGGAVALRADPWGGTLSSGAYSHTTTTTYSTALDVSGKGKLSLLALKPLSASEVVHAKVTIDGGNVRYYKWTDNSAFGYAFAPSPETTENGTYSGDAIGSSKAAADIHFKTSIKVEVKMAAGNTGNATVLYAVQTA